MTSNLLDNNVYNATFMHNGRKRWYMYCKRTLETFIQTASSQFPVVLVTGARQVGKTTFLQHMSGEKRSYITLDDPLARRLANDDPALCR